MLLLALQTYFLLFNQLLNQQQIFNQKGQYKEKYLKTPQDHEDYAHYLNQIIQIWDIMFKRCHMDHAF